MISYKKLIEALKRWQKDTAAEFDTPVHELVGWAYTNLDKLAQPEWPAAVPGSAEDLLTKTFFIVEANSFEAHILWDKHSKDSERIANKELELEWKPEVTHSVELGRVDGRPCCIKCTFSILKGRRVLFWESTSQVVDHSMIEAWFRRYFKGSLEHGNSRCDANNFHLCRNAILQDTKQDTKQA